ncbi:MAG: FG-GAP-like repeat-containing protein [Phycisphaerales bacterium]
MLSAARADAAGIIYVNAAAAPGGNGQSWPTAFNSLESALQAVTTPESTQLWMARGRYVPTNTNGNPDPHAAVFTVPSGLRLYGGFAGGETQLSQRNPTLNETILSGDVLNNDTPLPVEPLLGLPSSLTGVLLQRIDNVFRVVRLTGGAGNTLLDGLSIASGEATQDTVGGAGVSIESTPATLRQLIVRDNRSNAGGAGVLCINGHAVTIHGCLFERNVSTGDGGAALDLTATTGAPRRLIVNSRFIRNASRSNGAAIRAQSGNAVINQCLIVGNIADRGALSILTFGGTTSTISNCTVAFNVSHGGQAPVGIQAVGAPTRPVQIYNCIVTAGSSAGVLGVPGSSALPDIANDGAGALALTIVHCLGTLTGTAAITALINANPHFEDPLGPDALIGTTDDDFRLRPNSHAIDRGNPALLPADETDMDADGDTAEPIPYDLADAFRVQDDPSVLGIGVTPLDIGAYEQTPTINLRTACNTQSFTQSNVLTARLIVPCATNLIGNVPGGAPTTLNAAATGFTCLFIPEVAGAFSASMSKIALTTTGDMLIGDRASLAQYFLSLSLPGTAPVISARSLRVDMGQFRLNDEAIAMSHGLRVAGRASIVGPGTINADLVNEGALYVDGTALPAALMTINGAFTQRQSPVLGDAAPSVNLRVGGTLSDQVIATGPLSLAGTISVNLSGRAGVPPIGSVYTILAGASRTGTFDNAFLPGTADRLMRLVYTSSTRTAEVIAQVESRDNVVALAPPLGFPVPGTPSAAAVGKVHAAAYPNPDLAVVVPDPVNPTTAPGKLYILINLGTTATAWNGYAAVTISKTTGINPAGVAIADLNNDGRRDIALTNKGSDTVQIFYNTGNDDFAPPVSFATPDLPHAIAAGDIDQDGDTDLVVTCSPAPNRGTLLLCLQQAGVFTTTIYGTSLGADPTSIILADLDDADGLDAAVAVTGDDSIALIFNAGTTGSTWAGLRNTIRYFLAGDEPSSIQPGNIDNGKDESIGVTNAGSGTVSVLLRPPGTPSGPDQPYVLTSGPIGTNPRSFAFVDVNDDGSDDVVAIADGPTAEPVVRVLTTSTDAGGTVLFSATPDAPTQSPPTLVLRADLNNDGRDDIVAVGPETLARGTRGAKGGKTSTTGTTSNISAVLARPPCIADLTVDGVVNTADLLRFLGAFGRPATPGTTAFRADFNHDGFVTTSDLIKFLGRFGVPCP